MSNLGVIILGAAGVIAVMWTLVTGAGAMVTRSVGNTVASFLGLDSETLASRRRLLIFPAGLLYAGNAYGMSQAGVDVQADALNYGFAGLLALLDGTFVLAAYFVYSFFYRIFDAVPLARRALRQIPNVGAGAFMLAIGNTLTGATEVTETGDPYSVISNIGPITMQTVEQTSEYWSTVVPGEGSSDTEEPAPPE